MNITDKKEYTGDINPSKEFREYKFPEWLLHPELKLSSTTILVYSALQKNIDSLGNCYPSINKLSILTNKTQRTVRRCVQELCTKKLINRQRRKGYAGLTNSYIFHCYKFMLPYLNNLSNALVDNNLEKKFTADKNVLSSEDTNVLSSEDKNVRTLTLYSKPFVETLPQGLHIEYPVTVDSPVNARNNCTEQEPVTTICCDSNKKTATSKIKKESIILKKEKRVESKTIPRPKFFIDVNTSSQREKLSQIAREMISTPVEISVDGKIYNTLLEYLVNSTDNYLSQVIYSEFGNSSELIEQNAHKIFALVIQNFLDRNKDTKLSYSYLANRYLNTVKDVNALSKYTTRSDVFIWYMETYTGKKIIMPSSIKKPEAYICSLLDKYLTRSSAPMPDLVRYIANVVENDDFWQDKHTIKAKGLEYLCRKFSNECTL